MDDELTSSGSDGYLWYKLGELHAESRQETEALIAEVTGTAPVTRQEYNRVVRIVQQWQAECARLQAVGNTLAAKLQATEQDYAKLKAWADKCTTSRDEWKQRYEEQGRLTYAMSSRANRLYDELERYKEAGA